MPKIVLVMKKIILGFFLALSSMGYSQEAFTGNDDIRAYLGANIQSGGTGITGGIDYGLGQSFSLGFQASYLLGAKGSDGMSNAPFGDRLDIRGRFNANLGGVFRFPEQFDVYPGLSLSLKNLGGHLGARYFFNKGFGVFSEITFPIARYNTKASGFARLNNQFTFQIGAAFDLN